MDQPSTDSGSGEGIKVCGKVRRASATAPDSFVDALGYVELLVNIADQIKQCRHTKAVLDEARSRLATAQLAHDTELKHLQRMERRLADFMKAVEA